MKKVLIIFSGLVLVVLLIGITSHSAVADKDGCTTIKDGVLTYSPGHYLEGLPIKPGFDIFGYNYQAHMFNGYYANSYLGKDGFPPYEGDDVAYLDAYPGAAAKWYWPYRNVSLMMKWSDTWLSNKDCNVDGKLDRGYSCDPIDAGNSACESAWLTNHQQGTCVMPDGKENTWTYFVKIIAPPSDAELIGGVWFAADSAEIGPVIWTSFAVIQRVSNDSCWDEHGLLHKSPAGPGLRHFKSVI